MVAGESMLNESQRDIESLKSLGTSFFEGNYNETWNATLNQFDAFVANLSLYISCFEFNKFVGIHDEFELEKLGMDLVERRQLWAAVVFTNFPSNQKTDDLPNFIQYKIRMNADSVDSTMFVEDRISRPIPRREVPLDLKYIYLGFSFLQVSMIELS